MKETAIEVVKAKGTLKSGAAAAGVTYQTIWNEMKRSPIFARRMQDAQSEGKSAVGDKAVEAIKEIASENNIKDIRSRLTANLALANWAVPGFRGETRVSGRIEHNIQVRTAIPRPRYVELEKPKELAEAGSKDIIKNVQYSITTDQKE